MKNTTRLFLYIFALIISVCSPHALAQTTYTGAQINERVHFQNNNTNGINTVSLQSSTQNNALQAQAQIQNTTSNNKHVYYRFGWKNQTGNVNFGGWKPVLITPNQTQTIRETAPNSNIVDFQLELRVE